ncbi:MAG TPA: hypothetical protein VM531_03435 [Sphingomicrobium sp.]|jgi:hypothetical protein|nr:hypothetical protein [Sphingomicrobium sp.]
MTTITIGLPPKFIRDCQESDIDVGEYDFKRERLTATPEQLQELRNRAEFYCDPHGPDAASTGLKIAAKFLLNALNKKAPEIKSTLPEPERPKLEVMLIKHPPVRQEFDPDPEAQGYKDCQRGITANPYGVKHQRDRWDRGHDKAYAEGLGDKPRFGSQRRERN